MPKLTINGVEVEVERGTSVLEAARFLGLPIPTLCHDDGLTPWARVERARQLLLELYVATSPQSKTIQDLASRYGVTRVRLTPEFEDCIQCGKCVRICREQMMAGAIGFAYRGNPP